MKNLFDKNKYRLSDTEKSAIWRDISLAQTGRRRWWLPRLPRLKLAPAVATAAVTVCGLAIIFLVSRDDTQRFRRVESVVDKSDGLTGEIAPIQIAQTEIIQTKGVENGGLQEDTDAGQRHEAASEKPAPVEAMNEAVTPTTPSNPARARRGTTTGTRRGSAVTSRSSIARRRE